VHKLPLLCCISLFCSLTACGGGGGGGGTSSGNITISPASMSFTQEGQSVPPTQDITATFNGAGVAVGFAPGVTQPPWLYVSQGTAVSTTQARFTITATAPGALSFGTYTSSIRIVTGTSFDNPTGFVDLPVTFTYREAFSAQPGAFPFAFTEFAGNPNPPTPASGQITITGAGIGWQISATEPWITLSATSGTGAATVNVGVARPTVGPGMYHGEIVVTNNRNSLTARLPVDYTVMPAQLVLDKTSVNFVVDPQTTNSGITSSIAISDELQGAGPAGDLPWQATSNAAWLQLSAASGRTSPTATLTASLPLTELEQLPTGSRQAKITITATDRAGQAITREILVNLDLRLPYVRAIIPSVIAANTSASLRITGEGMEPENYPDLRVGTQTPGNIHRRIIVPSEAQFDVSPLASGQHVVTFRNSLGLLRSHATLVATAIVTPATPSVIVSSGAKSRLIYDRQRARLYAVDPTDHEIERFEWDGSSWMTLSTVSVPGIVDADLERSGRNLVIITDSEIRRLPLDASSPSTTSLYTLTDRTCGRSFFHVSVPDNEEALLTLTQAACPGGAEKVLIFDLIRGIFIDEPSAPVLVDAIVAASAREFTSYIATTKASSAINPLRNFASLTNGFSVPNIASPPDPILTLDTDATGVRVLLNNNTLAQFGVNNIRAVLPGPDGRVARLGEVASDRSRVYSYVHQLGNPRRVDAREMYWSGGFSPTDLGPLAITDDLGDVGRDADLTQPDTLAMTLAEEDRLLFVSGPSRIAVLQTPP
jgi:hypothetical protein